MKLVLSIAVLLFSGSAIAQDAPKISNEQPVQVKPTGAGGCEPLGSVEGRKLWGWGLCRQPAEERRVCAGAQTDPNASFKTNRCATTSREDLVESVKRSNTGTS